jgi:subtilisin family serine protease
MYGEYLSTSTDRKLLVSLFYKGDLSEIETAGFRTVWRGPEGYATGDILLSQLEQITSHPGVERISVGQEPEPMLDISVPDINASPEVWAWDSVQSLFSSVTGKGTGKGVIVGIIDTGIYWRHPFFLSQSSPEMKTKILSIWDMGLCPETGESAPLSTLLTPESGGTYGVEYKQGQINEALKGTGKVRHRDCSGHGTHVASIAAGNGGEARKFIGVAPEAELIVVKCLYPEETPKKNNDPTESEINNNIRFRDAVTYILKKAQAETKPVVINASLGHNLGPHDGFTPNEDWLTKQFESISKACFVTSAGNSGGKNQHATITFAAAGSIDIDIELIDTRTHRSKYAWCESRPDTPKSFWLQLYYPPAVGSLDISLDPKDGGGFRAGPSRGAGPVTATFEGFKAQMSHIVDNQARPYTGAPNVQRSKFQVEMIPKDRDEPKNRKYRTGTYTLRVVATEALTAHIWCQQKGWKFKMQVVAAKPPILTVNDEYQIGYYGGAANVLTVAAYNAEIKPALPTTNFSSRGPLANYSGAAPIPKPDIGAPGKAIDAAASPDVEPKKKDRKKADMTAKKQGTSMASPHVAGVVALMFENNPGLTAPDIVSIIRDDGFRSLPHAPANELGKGRIDAKLCFDKALSP